MELSVLKLCNLVAQKEYSELLGEGREIVSNIMDKMLDKYGKNEKFTYDLISHFIVYSVYQDEKISDKEINYVNEITGLNLTKSSIKSLYKEKASKGIDIFNILGCFKADILELFIYLAAYIFIVDGKINEQERKILRRLYDAIEDKNKVIRNVVSDKTIKDDLLIKQNEFLGLKDKLKKAYFDYSLAKERYLLHIERLNKIKNEYDILVGSLNDLRNDKYTVLKNKTHDDAIEIKKLEIELKKISFFKFRKKKALRTKIEKLRVTNKEELEEYENVREEIDNNSKYLLELENDIKDEDNVLVKEKEEYDLISSNVKQLESKINACYIEGLELYSYNEIIESDVILFGKLENKAIPWDVLEVKDNEVLLISHYILDMNAFNETSDDLLNGSNYNNSLIRSFMNGPLMNKIFTKNQKEKIILSKVDNSKESTTFKDVLEYKSSSDDVISIDTWDYLYPISVKEVYKYYDKKYQSLAEPNDYAVNIGLHKNRKTGFSVYWTRTPYDKDKCYLVVSDIKEANTETDFRLDIENCKKETLGIRPLMKLKIDEKDNMILEAVKIYKENNNL